MTPEVLTSDGLQLQAEADVPTNASAIVVLSHPHPMFGGDMYNPLIDYLFEALPKAGVGALRYNFRGVGRSQGEFADAVGERLDAAAAFAAGVELAGGSPVWSCGWSFGGDVSLSADHAGLAGWIAVAAPLKIVDPSEMAAPADARPKLLIVPEHDQYRTPASAADATAEWTNARLVQIDGADHFLGTQAAAVADAVNDFIGSAAS
ncbi:MAG: alpha/beta superfamily hydrolase [Candidatus Poriferisodalaceae bacterium]|jgi:alpha/beta superfamily hydrolase